MMLSKEARAKFKKQGYRIVGNHSAIKICDWCRKALRGDGVCYKQRFYPELVKSHRCVQMSCTLTECSQRCVFCWRDLSYTTCTPIKNPDSPKTIVDGCIKAHKEILQGFKGNPKVSKEKFDEAMQPTQFAISLTGEGCLYPRLGDLIKELRKRKIVSFLVTNGQHPDVIKKLADEDALPTQLYVSIEAPFEELYKKIDNPIYKDGWKRINQTLKLLPELNCRKVLRITLIKGLNDSYIKEWAKFIKQAGDLWIEVKAYMHVGYSRKRLKKEDMPLHSEVREFSEKLAKTLDWIILDEQARSRVVLIGKNKLPKIDFAAI